MPTCQSCENTFPNRAVVDGVVRVISSRKRCLECSPFGQRNTRTNEADALWKQGLKTCGGCRLALPLEDFAPQGTYRASRCRECDRTRVRERQRRLKLAAVTYKGGRCVLCGYDRCVSALDFHHTDPASKDFHISQWRGALGKNGELTAEVRVELDKCDLVCCRCHREVHAGLHEEKGSEHASGRAGE